MNDGAQTNRDIGAFPPYLLTNVKPTSKLVTGIYDNVCVVAEKSVVAFDLRSWGAVGFKSTSRRTQDRPSSTTDSSAATRTTPINS
jgi:hypothetical protein